MNITNGIKIIGLCLYIKKEKTLAIGDLHIGYEESLNKRGILIPRHQLRDMKENIKKINKSIKKVILLGDIKHEFKRMNKQEWKESIEFIEFIKNRYNNPNIIIIKGNHDNYIEDITHETDVKIYEKYNLGSICFVHGDKEIETDKKIIIIGHEHPAITISDSKRREKFKCFVKAKYKDKTIIIVPSFLPITEGTDLTRDKLLSPYTKNSKDIEIFVVGDKTYYFGHIKDM